MNMMIKIEDRILLTPISSTNILSKPTGPNELFTMFAMEQAAITKIKFNSIYILRI